MNGNYLKMSFFKHNLYLEKNLSILGENWLIKESQWKIQIAFLIFFFKAFPNWSHDLVHIWTRLWRIIISECMLQWFLTSLSEVWRFWCDSIWCSPPSLVSTLNWKVMMIYEPYMESQQNMDPFQSKLVFKG